MCVQSFNLSRPPIPHHILYRMMSQYLFHPTKDFALAKAKFTGSDGKVDDSKYRNELYGYGVSPLACFVLFVEFLSLVFVFLRALAMRSLSAWFAPVDLFLEDRD